MRLRIATPEDVPELFNVRASVKENILTIEEMATIGITHTSLSEMIESGIGRAYCVEADGIIAGFSLADKYKREIVGLFVLPEYEGRGFGTVILESAMRWLLQDNHSPIRLDTSPETRAFAFYKKRGWRETGLRPQEDVLEGDVTLEYQP